MLLGMMDRITQRGQQQGRGEWQAQHQGSPLKDSEKIDVL
jgi:hypothetical protein